VATSLWRVLLADRVTRLGEFLPIERVLSPGSFFWKITKLLIRRLNYVLILIQMDWATFWAIFFTNPSGHPACRHKKIKCVIYGREESIAFGKKCCHNFDKNVFAYFTLDLRLFRRKHEVVVKSETRDSTFYTYRTKCC
jgi:hypothetical protein